MAAKFLLTSMSSSRLAQVPNRCPPSTCRCAPSTSPRARETGPSPPPSLALPGAVPAAARAHSGATWRARVRPGAAQRTAGRRRLGGIATRTLAARDPEQIQVEAALTEARVTALFAWISRAFAGDPRFGDLSQAFAAVFGLLPEDHPLSTLLAEALRALPPEDLPVGQPFSRRQREEASLGAMGAAQWTGQFRTRPHALLDVRGMASVDEWVRGLGRGARRTLKKAAAQPFTVTVKPIEPGRAAPHSSLAHFRAVVAHEVRLLADSPEEFFGALQTAVGRYIGTTRMAGEVREYRSVESGRVIAFAHEVRKGRTIRGQWFYADDEAARSFVWFHATQELVRRAIECEDVDTVDLGPSGSDAFSDLKHRYGFVSVEDWPAVADYLGPFYSVDGAPTDQEEEGMPAWLKEMLRR